MFAQARVATEGVGEVSFPNSGAPEAQGAFLRGLAQLHNFEYGSAAAAFREAQEIDPGFAMAYWGEAMTYNHTVWMEQDREAALAALERLSPTREGRIAAAQTEREKAYLRAVEILYGDGDKQGRDDNYAEVMRALYEAYPDDHEAAAFFALSLLGTAHEGRDFATYMRAAAVVEEVFDRQPRHPGAAHYLIHSYDDPIHAPLGLRAAVAYSSIAPDAAHAQHMTSHIFVAMGMWDDVVRANETAVAVVDRARSARGGPALVCGHYPFWLEYGYLQQGRPDDAKRILRGCRDAARSQEAASRAGAGDLLDPDNTLRASYVQMRTRYIVDSEEWDSEVLGWEVPMGEAWGDRLTYVFGTGFAAARRGDLVAAHEAHEALLEARQGLEAVLRTREDSGGQYGKRASILERQLRAVILAEEGRVEDAIALVREAVAEEESLPFIFGPPYVDKPSHELLGELLLASGRAGEAREAFVTALSRTPERITAQSGLTRATAHRR
jgi:tetratricopeptide (TPR) repeat protein